MNQPALAIDERRKLPREARTSTDTNDRAPSPARAGKTARRSRARSRNPAVQNRRPAPCQTSDREVPAAAHDLDRTWQIAFIDALSEKPAGTSDQGLAARPRPD